MTWGNRDFSKDMESRFVNFNHKIQTYNNVTFENVDFTSFIELKQDDFVYLDPPYLITLGSYNDGKRGFNGWNENEEKRLLGFLDKLNKKNIKFALSNVSIYRGENNDLLCEWMKSYNVHDLDFKYTNNNRYQKDNSSITQEVLITNY